MKRFQRTGIYTSDGQRHGCAPSALQRSASRSRKSRIQENDARRQMIRKFRSYLQGKRSYLYALTIHRPGRMFTKGHRLLFKPVTALLPASGNERSFPRVVRRESPDLSAAWWRTRDLPLMADEQTYRETMGQRRRRSRMERSPGPLSAKGSCDRASFKLPKTAATFLKLLATPAGFEPATTCLEGRCSIQLS